MDKEELLSQHLPLHLPLHAPFSLVFPRGSLASPIASPIESPIVSPILPHLPLGILPGEAKEGFDCGCASLVQSPFQSPPTFRQGKTT